MSVPAGAEIAPRRLTGRILHQERLGSSMRRLVIELEEGVGFHPGQFCMVNFTDRAHFPLSRPLSILSAASGKLELVYKIVGTGTKALSTAAAGTPVRVLTPLGSRFKEPADGSPCLVLAGGVGLPPLWAWRRAYGRPDDLFCFGGRDVRDVPWPLLDDDWRVSVDRIGLPAGEHEVFVGTVVDLADHILPTDASVHQVLVCGPLPLLRAAVSWALRRGWPCQVSVEERMGCGYGVCRGCVTPAAGGGWWTACQDGPVFDAEDLDWTQLGRTCEVTA